MNTAKSHLLAKDSLTRITGGLHALSIALAARIPEQFDWWFLFDRNEIVAGWGWKGRECSYQNEIRTGSLASLLVEWQQINWSAELRIAREFCRTANPFQPQLTALSRSHEQRADFGLPANASS